MSRKPTPVELSEQDRQILARRVRSGTTEQRMDERAKLILAAAEGQSTVQIAAELGTRPSRVSMWRTRFSRYGLAGLQDRPRPGAPRRYDESTEQRILAKLDESPPAGHYKRRRRRDFLDFMNDLVADYPDQEIHVILDNLNTHKPKRDGWLGRHPNVHFHYTPTSAAWLNQVECWFSILSRRALRGASFTSPRQLREAIDRFIEAYNADAAPFEWRKTAVHPKGLRRKYVDLCNQVLADRTPIWPTARTPRSSAYDRASVCALLASPGLI